MESSLQENFSLSKTANWGNDPEGETFGEVFLHALTEIGSVAYYREMGTEAVRMENRPANIFNLIRVGTGIINSVQLYNENSTEGDTERRVVVDFSDIEFEDTNKNIGEVDIRFFYTPLRNVNRKSEVRI